MRTSLYKTMLLGAFATTMAGAVHAQDNYDAQQWTNSDLNGTARFVAMGGALGALGGDVSVMSTNPAAIGVYRKGDAAFGLSGLFVDDKAMDFGRSRLSLDQGGIVLSFDSENPTGRGLQFVNIGMNVQKKRNFFANQVTDIRNLNDMFSQTYQIAALCNMAFQQDYYGSLADMSASTDKRDGILYESQGEDGNIIYEGLPAQGAYFEKSTHGYNLQADACVSFNVEDRFFFGASLGMYELDYSRESFYQELGMDGNAYDFTNWYRTTGNGFDVKLGFVCRPIEDSPFRFGVSVHTPTWYSMTDANGAMLYFNEEYYLSSVSNEEYDYRYHSPWKFGLSLGHTVGQWFAVGVECEYQDPSSCRYREFGGGWSDYFYNTNRIMSEVLRGQYTFKVGAEIKPIEEFAIRLGYNHVSSPFKKGAFRTIGYDSVYTETDYTNWGGTDRFTFGLGYRYKGGYIDFAWQYQTSKGDFYAFDDIDLLPTQIKNNRSQLMATFGFRFSSL